MNNTDHYIDLGAPLMPSSINKFKKDNDLLKPVNQKHIRVRETDLI